MAKAESASGQSSALARSRVPSRTPSCRDRPPPRSVGRSPVRGTRLPRPREHWRKPRSAARGELTGRSLRGPTSGRDGAGGGRPQSATPESVLRPPMPQREHGQSPAHGAEGPNHAILGAIARQQLRGTAVNEGLWRCASRKCTIRCASGPPPSPRLLFSTGPAPACRPMPAPPTAPGPAGGWYIDGIYSAVCCTNTTRL